MLERGTETEHKDLVGSIKDLHLSPNSGESDLSILIKGTA